MRYLTIKIDPNKPEATILLRQLENEFSSIGLVLKSNGQLEYDETDEVLMAKLKAILAKYPKALSIS